MQPVSKIFLVDMTETLRDRLQQTEPFDGPDQEAMLALLVASAAVRGALNDICAEHDVLASQYNILRILHGGPPEGYPRCEIIERMIDRGPDVTRLVDELEEQGLVDRYRSQEDRRMMMHRITDEGRRRLHEVTEDLGAVHDPFDEVFSEAELEELTQYCTRIAQRFE
jgi:DNA-binding MarR family transcriptional regulator